MSAEEKLLDVRSRPIARQIRGAHEDPMFVPSPPLEALRSVLSDAATDTEGEKPKRRDGKSSNRMQISLIDISRAYFNATCNPEKPTFVALPTEHPDYTSKSGVLLKHMYGTQAAADGWHQEYSQTLIDLEFLCVSPLKDATGVQRPC